MPKIIIDDTEIDVEEGLNIIQAATRLGIDIPHFCYHPSLSIVAQCRQCLVEVEGVPKVMPACNTFVRDGLIVKTNSEKALQARRATVEFTLINHPLDCPICDKGGECPLQLTTFEHGPGYSRFEEPENKKIRRKYYLSDKILYDPNRCIMCTRCVRFTDEVTKTSELGTSGRGYRKKIVVFPGKELDNELAGNVIDLCPVGALLSKDDLHKERVWYWDFTDTICTLCSNGCNITVGVDPRKGKVERVRPRINMDVNEYWICDRGRYGFKDIQENNRLINPIKKSGDTFENTTWDEASELLYQYVNSSNLSSYKKIGFIGSAKQTNEELYLLKLLFEKTGADYLAINYYTGNGKKEFGLISPDPFPNTQGVKDHILGSENVKLDSLLEKIINNEIDTLFVISEDLFQIIPQEKSQLLKDALEKIMFIAVLDTKITETLRYADLILPGVTPYENEGTYTNDQARVQRIKKTIDSPGNSKTNWEIINLIGNRFDKLVFNYFNTEEIFADIILEQESYEDLNYEKIGMFGLNTK